MSKFTKSFSELFKTKRFLIVLSVVLSFLIWYSLTIYYNPVSTRKIKDVPIMFDTSETAIAGMGLEIVSQNIDSVEVVITGKTANVQKITASDITITPSMSSITDAGEYEVALNYSKSMLSDFDIVSIKPSTVTLTVDAVVSRDFAVTAVANGATAKEGLVCESPTITDSAYKTLTVSGARNIIEKIYSVTARADVNAELASTTEYEADIVLLDSEGNEVDKSGLELSFNKASITVSISKIKTVGINAVFENAPKSPPLNYNISVSTVSVIGDPKVIDLIDHIDLLPIDYGKITPSNKEFECSLNLPTGIRVHDGPDTVTVTFDTSGIRSNVLKVQNLTYTNFDESLGSVKLNSPLTVTVYGLRADITKLTSADLTLNVSLRGYDDTGSYTVPATVTVGDGYESVWVSTYNKEYSAYITIG